MHFLGKYYETVNKDCIAERQLWAYAVDYLLNLTVSFGDFPAVGP